VEFLGETAGQASEHMIRDVLKPGDGGIIAVDVDGRVSMPFSTQGMFRGYLDGTGQCGVGIWEELQPGD
jgi:beta-aspartyl-peptidase (threonine type)